MKRQAGQRLFILPTTSMDAEKPVHCLFSVNQVVEILGKEPVCRLPFAPAAIPGVMHYFGQLLPVVDIDRLLGGRGSESGFRQLIVLRTGAADPLRKESLKVAVATADTLGMLRLEGSGASGSSRERTPPAQLAGSSLLKGYFSHNGIRVAVLDLGPLARGDWAPGGAY